MSAELLYVRWLQKREGGTFSLKKMTSTGNNNCELLIQSVKSSHSVKNSPVPEKQQEKSVIFFVYSMDNSSTDA